MTHSNQHTESTGAPSEGRPRTRAVSARTVLGSLIAVATVGGAIVLGVRTLADEDESMATRRPSTSASAGDTEASASAWTNTGTTPTCSIWSFPSLETAPVPQSNLREGLPYVAVCVDGDEETTFVFLYGDGLTGKTAR